MYRVGCTYDFARTTLYKDCTTVVAYKGAVNMKTIKQYAEEQGVSYEAIRKQISTYKDELKEHIVIKGRTQYLDDWAVNFLTERRKENPVIIVSQEKADEVEAMRKQIETLQTQLLLAQNALIQNQKDMIKDKETIIGLQAEAQKALEDRLKYAETLEEKDALLIAAKDDARMLYSQLEASRKVIQHFEEEAKSYEKAFFGLYKKKKVPSEG